jgi:hypothetical protein
MSSGLTADNFSKGFLVDDEWIGGVTPDPETPSRFAAYVLKHTSGEYLAYQVFDSLDEALTLLNQVPRGWSYEALGGCANGNCGQGQCRSGNCAVSRATAPAGSD